MESRRKVLRALFGALLLLVVFLFFLAGILVNRSAQKKPTVTVSSTKIFKHWKLIGREKHAVVWDSTFIYVSKRRVPNGPDPIHNSCLNTREGDMHTETEERDFPIPRDATVASQINNTMLCGEFKTHGIVSLVQETKMASWGVGEQRRLDNHLHEPRRAEF